MALVPAFGHAEVGAEVKVSVAPDRISEAVRRLGLRLDQAKEREIQFYDTPTLFLYRHGVILRLRHSSGEKAGVTVKLKPLSAENVDSRWFDVEGFSCELDFATGSSSESCALQEKREAISGDLLLSKAQKRLLKQYGPAQPPEWGSVNAMGPIRALVWKLGDQADTRVELWVLPGRERILELSRRTGVEAAEDAHAELLALLRQLGVREDPRFVSKTEFALRTMAQKQAKKRAVLGQHRP